MPTKSQQNSDTIPHLRIAVQSTAIRTTMGGAEISLVRGTLRELLVAGIGLEVCHIPQNPKINSPDARKYPKIRKLIRPMPRNTPKSEN